LLLFIFAFLFQPGFAAKKKIQLSKKQKKVKIKNLDNKYKHWWSIIYHISTDEERDVFLKLGNNRDRDIFIKTFWQQRDPTPGTEENEFKNEIETRFAYVEKYFSRGTSRAGWLTDMGKFYMMLGKPTSIERFDSKPGIYPAQVWYYHGDPSLGLPPMFTVTFYKPYNTTEWKFYNPSSDGPAALLIKQAPVDESNSQGIYKKIKELVPELAMPAITMVPNEIGPNYRPTLRNNLVISNIYEAPKRKINVSYATHFLNYKGYVDVESSINYVESSNLVSISRYERFGFNFINFSFKPQKISLGYNEDKKQYFFNFEVSVSLRKGEKYIYEYKKNFDLYFDPDKVAALKANGIVIHDSFPVIPGDYKLMVYSMNSIGKEFTYFEKDVSIKPLSDTPLLATPLVGYKSETQADNFFFTYRFNNQKLFVDTSKNIELKGMPLLFFGAYNLTREMWQKGKVEILLQGLNERLNFKKTYNIPLNKYSYKRDLNIMFRLAEDVDGLKPDYYETEIKLLDGTEKIYDTKEVRFGISPLHTVSHPMETFKKVRADNPFFFYYILAQQYEKINNISEAESYYRKAVANNPEFKEGYIGYLNILNKQKKYTQVLVEVEKLQNTEKFSFDYHLIKATALYGMKDFNEALDHLLKANTIYDSDPRVLNLLGFTLLNLNEYEEALKAFDASLSVDDKQNFIKQTIKKVKDKIGAKSPQKKSNKEKGA